MYKVLYLIPILGTQEVNIIAAERTRVGNIFDITRQSVTLNRSYEDGKSTTEVKFGIDTFAKLDNVAFSSLTLENSETAPLLVPTQTAGDNSTKAASTAYVDAAGGGGGLWNPSKYHIEAGESVTVKEKYQQLFSNEIINDGSITVDGELIFV